MQKPLCVISKTQGQDNGCPFPNHMMSQYIQTGQEAGDIASWVSSVLVVFSRSWIYEIFLYASLAVLRTMLELVGLPETKSMF